MRKRNAQINVRVTDDEYYKFREIARKAGMTVTALFRTRCLDDGKIVIINSDAMHDLYREINAIGNNINQIARVANSTQYVSTEDVLLMQEHLHGVKTLLVEKLKGV